MKRRLSNLLNMSLIESKIAVKSFFFVIFLVFTSCGEGKKESTEEVNQKEEKTSFEDRAKRWVESELEINATEKYNLQIKKAYIDRDTLEDAVILVNREQWAYERAKEQDNFNFLQKLGFTGPFNYVFVYLAKKDKFLSTPPVGSSAKHPLEVEFETLTLPSQKDFYVNYRIRNSLKRNYYTVRNDKVYLTFNCPVFDSIGSPDPVIYDIQHSESTTRLAKDIALYEAKIPQYNPDKIENPNNYTPERIISTGELFVFFIFDEKRMKYVTPMTRKETN